MLLVLISLTAAVLVGGGTFVVLRRGHRRRPVSSPSSVVAGAAGASSAPVPAQPIRPTFDARFADSGEHMRDTTQTILKAEELESSGSAGALEDAADLGDVLAHHCNTPPANPADIRPDRLPPLAGAVFAKAMAKSREQRFQSPTLLYKALKSLAG